MQGWLLAGRQVQRFWLFGILLVLLCAGILGRNSSIYLELSGRPERTSGGDDPIAHGYYEALINMGGRVLVDDGSRPPVGWVAFGDPAAGLVREVPSYLRWEMPPKLDTTWNNTKFQTNGAGYRTPECQREKPAGTYRVVVFGSSNSMAYGVDEEDGYVRLLESWMRRGVSGGRRVEVVNLAVAGDSPSRRLYRLQIEAKRYQPDWIFFDASVFDGFLEASHLSAVLERHLPVPLDYIRETMDRCGLKPGDSPEVVREKLGPEPDGLLEATYGVLATEARKLAVPVTIMILPRADSQKRSPKIVRAMHDSADRHGLEVIDLSEAFEGMTEPEFRLSAWDKHPSVRGHAAIFEALRDALILGHRLPWLDH
jgi:hypothetical protein